LSELGTPESLSALSYKFLTSWGLDLEKFDADKNSRDTASYRPSHVTNIPYTTAIESCEFIINLWNLSNPDVIPKFNQLDKYLVRNSLDLVNNQYLNPRGKSKTLEERITPTLMSLSIDETTLGMWKDFFAFRTLEDPILLIDAKNHTSNTDPRNHFGIIARASLLLRIATGSCFQFIKSAPFSLSDLEFWWGELGMERGMWNPSNKPSVESEDIISLWEEVNLALENIELWKDKKVPYYYDLIKENADSLNILESCERIGFWGLLP
jgi:hypothetical protein